MYERGLAVNISGYIQCKDVIYGSQPCRYVFAYRAVKWDPISNDSWGLSIHTGLQGINEVLKQGHGSCVSSHVFLFFFMSVLSSCRNSSFKDSVPPLHSCHIVQLKANLDLHLILGKSHQLHTSFSLQFHCQLNGTWKTQQLKRSATFTFHCLNEIKKNMLSLLLFCLTSRLKISQAVALLTARGKQPLKSN